MVFLVKFEEDMNISSSVFVRPMKRGTQGPPVRREFGDLQRFICTLETNSDGAG